jgi:methylenetetrahydrofolate reductase (NADPH)
MRIADCFSSSKPVFSFEFFPPKTPEAVDALFSTVADLAPLQPSFVSVTYGAGGSTRQLTVDLVSRIKNEIGLEAMAHLTCVGHSRDEIRTVLDKLESASIENVLALRGDPPRGEKTFVAHAEGFSYGYELVDFIRARYGFCLCAAAYPEGHLETPDKEADLFNLKRKVDAGADFLITQLFFESQDYFQFVERARAIGISVPIVPGIMPVTNVKQLDRYPVMCGASIPHALRARVEKVRVDEEALISVGIEWATEQCKALLAGGAPGIHFYTLNKSRSALKVFQNLFGS